MKVKVGVLGLGFMGSAHARVYSKLRGCELFGVCDKDLGKRYLAEAYNCKFFEDSEVFLKEDFDALSICTPTSTHRDLAMQALENGKHILVEKPLAANSRDGQEIVEKAVKMDKLLVVGYIERFNSAVTKLKEIADFSQIFSTVSLRLGPIPPRTKDIGVLLDLGTHEIDVLNYLTGTFPKVIYAHVASKLNNTFEDYAYISLKYGEIHSHIETSWLPTYKLRLIHLYGNQRFYILNYAQQALKSYRHPPKVQIEHGSWQDIVWLSRNIEEVIQASPTEPLELELRQFVNSVTKGEVLEPLCQGHEGLHVLRDVEESLQRTRI